MVYSAGEFLKTTGIWNPYASDPGTTEQPLLACRKSFHIFMTDGDWNSESDKVNGVVIKGKSGNADGTARTLPDGTVYDPYNTLPDADNATLSWTKIYRDAFGNSTTNTLADFAFDQWATDAQPTIPNEVRPIIRQAGPADYGPTGSPYWLPEYWNPKNNPATWQSLVTYTIGFKNAANMGTARTNRTVSINGTNTNIKLPAWGGNTWSGDFAPMIRGDVDGTRPVIWGNPLANSSPERRQELWHMALNGRGRFVPATSATELSNAFAEIVNQIIADSSTPLASIASNTQTVSAGTKVYTAGYDAAKWSGFVQARNIQTNYNLGTTTLWDAATVLDSTAATARLIFTHNETAGTTFEWDNLSAGQKNLVKGSDSNTVGENRVNYLRGVRTGEQSVGGVFRNRTTKLGDIVNSNLWVVGKPEIGYTFSNYSGFRTTYASRPTMIYVGANDGMLHGFNAADGSEKMAYVPKGVYSKLKSYTEPSYVHEYMVDGHPYTGDIHDGTNWKTMLVGTLAGGGKGYFVLDVTNPAGWSSTSGSGLVVADNTDGTDADIGHIYSEPTLDTTNPARAVQITKLNNNRWAVLMGNGANSSSEKAVLLIQYLDGAKELVKMELDGTGGNGNGLANPQVIDINGDGKADVAYVGDLLGNLWKVNLSSSTATNWGSYFLTGAVPAPLYVARDGSNARQPIVTAPQWAAHPTKGIMVAFGTGREMTIADRTTTSTQTLYSVWDNTEFKPSASPMMVGGTVISNGRSDLVAQTQTSAVTISGRKYFKTSNNAVPYTGAGAKRGWYMDWPNLGERAVNNGGMLSSRLLFMRSRIPANGTQDTVTEESCTPNATAADEYLTILDIVNGNAPTKPVFDTDGGGMTGTEEAGVTRWESGREDRVLFRTGKPGELVSVGSTNNGGGNNPCTGANAQCIAVPQNLTGFGWRQLQ
jgi:type IV pilus assembly protein PilY1